MPAEPKFYAEVRGVVAAHGPRISCIRVTSNIRDDGTGGMVIHTVSEIQNRTPEDIADEVKQAIHDDSGHWPGVLKYLVTAHDQDGDVLGGRIVIDRKGRGKMGDGAVDGGLEDEAAPRGHMGQMMRHNEGMFRTTLQNNQIVLDIFARALADSNVKNERLMSEHLRVMSLAEDILDRRGERDLFLNRERKKDELKDNAIKMVMQFAPVLMGHAAQGTRLEEPMKQITQGSQLMVLVESFKKDPARFGKVLACFTDEEKLALFSQNFDPILESFSRAATDLTIAARLMPLAEILSQEEKLVIAQLAELHEKKKNSGSGQGGAPAEVPKKVDIEVRQVPDPKVVPIDSAKRGA